MLALLLLLGGTLVWADERDDQYLGIFYLIDQADALQAKGNNKAALAKYQEAQTALVNFRKRYPDWKANIVSFRLNYVVRKAAECAPETSSTLQLLGQGAEPRKTLRFHPKAGDKQTLALTVKLGMDMKMGDMPGQAVQMPAIKLTMASTIKAVAPEGDITYEMLVTDAELLDEAGPLPQVLEQAKASLTAMKGISGTSTISSRGITKSVNMIKPAEADPQKLQMIEQLRESLYRITCPLPEEAVGLGAKWQVTLPDKSEGVELTQTETYELVSVEGETFKTRTTIAQTASPQKIQNPAMPGLKMDLTSMNGTGTGDLTINLAQLLPVASNSDLQSEYAMSLNAGPQKQKMSMTRKRNLRVESQP